MRGILLWAYNARLIFLALLVGTAGQAQPVKDADIKIQVETIHQPMALVNQLKPRLYSYNTSQYRHLNLPGGTHYGFIAEDLATVMPEVVGYRNISYRKGKNFYKTANVPYVDMERLVPLLVASMQQLQTEIERLKTEISVIRKQMGVIPTN